MTVEEFKDAVARIPRVFDKIDLWYVELSGISMTDKGLHVHAAVDEPTTISNAETDYFDYYGVEIKPEPFIRASGNCVCEVCGSEYRRHADDMKQLDHGGHPFLKVLCDRTRVKL